jgi:uncharacterized protein (TIGR00255 family)
MELMEGKSVALQSMTGFALSSGQSDNLSWEWQARSVNGRSLDVRVRVPAGFESVERVVRDEVAKKFKRGNISLSLTLNRSSVSPTYSINNILLEQIFKIQESLKGRISSEPLSLDLLLSIRGMLEVKELNDDHKMSSLNETELIKCAMEVLTNLSLTRYEEGKQLKVILERHIKKVTELTDLAYSSAAVQPDSHRDRLRKLLAGVLEPDNSLTEERLLQETALLIIKSDVREELDRLRAHINAANTLLAEGGPVGRRFDFLCQEFNRESNTVCSKSSDIELTKIGLELKAAIEQLREQVQNVE